MVLKSHYQVLSLTELGESIKTQRIPERAVVLTFDDGYVELLNLVKPLLEECQFPAVAFIVAGQLGDPFWWDMLENIIFSPERLPDILSLSQKGLQIEWSNSGKEDRRTRRSQDVNRERLLNTLYDQLRYINSIECNQLIQSLAVWANVNLQKIASITRSMNTEETLELVKGGYMEVGSHSLTHPWLTDLNSSDQIKEIKESKRFLEEILGQSVRHFSYPNGAVTEVIADQVRQAGFQTACTSAHDVIRKRSDLYQLPRFWVRDLNGQQFKRWLQMWD